MTSDHIPPAFAETVTVHDRVVACDGGGGTLGHPRVFLRIVERMIECPYCSRRFVLEGDEQEQGH